MIKCTKFIPTLLAALLINAEFPKAATTVISEGVASITSTLGDNIYRKRAIENALQNIAISTGQELTSFTIVENGQMLFDQIQSTSTAGVLSYKVLSERKKNEQYHVKIEAIVEDHLKQNFDEKLPSCRPSNFPAVDLTFHVKIDPQQFPPWMGLNREWILNQLAQKNYKPDLVLTSNKSSKNSNMDLYTLFDNHGTIKDSKNIYQVDLHLNFTKKQNESFFIKNQIISLVANSEIRRNGVSVENQSQKFNFVIKKKFGVGIPIQSNKKLWEQEKQRIIFSVIRILNNKLDLINCSHINATLKENKENYYIDYGSFDGITHKDIFVVDSINAEKFYFKVDSVTDHRTQLKLISEANKIDLKDGYTVRIVEEL